MRRHDLQTRHRRCLVWYCLGFILVQISLGVGVDQFWTAVRDPDYEYLEREVRDRQAQLPGRPLVLVLGSSRTRMALRAEQLCNTGSATAPLIINAAANRNCAMMQQVYLRRLLAAGIRPEMVLVEIIPHSLSIREGTPAEESMLLPARLTLAEATRVWGYCSQKYRLYRWVTARVFPIDRHRAELRECLAFDLPVGADVSDSRYELERFLHKIPEENREVYTQCTIQGWAKGLTEPAPAPGAVQALRDIITLCNAERIPATLMIPAENSGFRSYAPAVAEAHLSLVHSLAHELGVEVIDARTWVDDDGFYDGHHANDRGADQYTGRFRREVLAPFVSPRPSWSAASSSVRGGLE